MKAKYLIIAALLFGTATASLAQTSEQINESRRQYYYNYGRWSVGLNAGMSALFGDFSTFSDEKFYPAPIGSAFVSYQVTPTIGVTLEGYYSRNRVGALSGNATDYLNTTGFYSDIAANPLTGEQFLQYRDLYSDINLWQGRLGVDINLSNVFGGNKGERMRPVTVIFSPSYYLQYYRPKVKRKSDDGRYSKRDLFYQVSNGVGAELAVRLRASRIVDFQLKGGGVYGFNKKFEGVAGGKKTNILAYAQVGVVFKLNGKHRRDNLIYAATPAYVPRLDFVRHDTIRIAPNTTPQGIPTEVVQHDTIYIDRVVEVPVERVVYRWHGNLPAIGFERGSAVIDEVKYASQLAAILGFLKDNADATIDIYAYADHTGTDNLNYNLTQQRAEALRVYLVQHGVAGGQIGQVVGKGKDLNLDGEDALSVRARRAEAVTR